MIFVTKVILVILNYSNYLSGNGDKINEALAIRNENPPLNKNLFNKDSFFYLEHLLLNKTRTDIVPNRPKYGSK